MYDLDYLEKKINNIEKDLKKIEKDNLLKKIINSNNYNNLDEDIKINVKNEYYNTLSENEKDYQKINDKYKKWISNYSKAYIELSEFYVGEELPREHYLQSKKDIIELYKLFLFYGMMEPYLNLFKN